MKMKKLVMLVVLFSLMFPAISSARVVYCDRECFELRDHHILTIKGLLYEVADSQSNKTKKTFLPHVAETIVWMEKKHKEEKIYKLGELKKEDKARLINTSVSFIIDVLNGKTKFNPHPALFHWTALGEKVIAEYSEKIVDKKAVVEYKLELKK